MVFLFSAIFLLSSVRDCKSEDLIIFDNFDYGSYIFGAEDLIVDYALLSIDRKMDLPTSFTICSSLHLNFVAGPMNFYQLYQDDGQPWFTLFLRPQKDLNRFQDRFSFWFYMSSLYDMNTVPIKPNSWYHSCTALDTVTGHILIVVNGHIVIDQVLEEFINSINEKPKSLEGRLSIFKNVASGTWTQGRQRLSNLNVYTSALTVDKMISLT